MLDVGTAGEHLHGGRGGVDLLGRPRPRHEEHDAEALASAVHGEDLGHPRADPLQVLGRLDDPHEHDLAGRDRAVGIARDEVPHPGDGLRDADTTGEEHHGAVGGHAVDATVGPLHVAGCHQAAIGTGGSLLVQGSGEASTSTDDVGHTGLAEAQDVVTVHGQLLAIVHLGLLAPAHGEGVGLPPADARKVQVRVLAGCESPGACHGGGDADGVAGEGLDKSLGAASAQIAVGEADHTSGAVKGPEGDDGEQVVELRQAFNLQMVPGANQSDGSADDVEDLEGLVPGVSQDAARLNEEEDKGDSTDETVQQEGHRDSLLEDSGKAFLSGTSNPVGQGVSDGLEHHNTSNPSVKEVEGVERHVQPLDQRVVASSHEPQGNHVHDGKHTGTVAELIGPSVEVAMEGDIGNAEGNVGGKVGDQADELESRGQCAHVDGGAEGELAVVPLAEKGRILDASLEEGISP